MHMLESQGMRALDIGWRNVSADVILQWPGSECQFFVPVYAGIQERHPSPPTVILSVMLLCVR